MQTTTPDTVFWNRVARRYAKAAIRDMPGYEKTVARASELLGPAHIVLEIGCGTGTTALRLASAVRHITATDASSEMIAIAREKAEAQSYRNVDFTICAAEDAPGDPGQYDAVVALHVLHLVRDRATVLTRARRLLRPGGLLITKTPCVGEMSAMIRYVVPLAQWFGKAPHVAAFSGDQLRAEIAAAGFDVIESTRHGSKRKDYRAVIIARRSDG